MPLTDISVPNIGWGVCGFSSSLGALYEHEDKLGADIRKNIKSEDIHTRLLAEMKTYLVLLQSEHEDTVLDDIASFTKSFGGVHQDFTIQSYIDRINKLAADSGTGPISPSDYKDNEKFGIAMSPAAVVDYLKRVCQIENARVIDKDSDMQEDIIIGLGNPDPDKPFGGLGHWVFQKNINEVYNWGEMKTQQEVLNDPSGGGWQILYKIALF